MEEKRRLELIQWMDTQIEIRKQMQEERYCGETVTVCCNDLSDGIHIYAGIGELARAAKAEILFFKRSDVNYPFEHYFEYKGVKFYQLEESGCSFKNLLEGMNMSDIEDIKVSKPIFAYCEQCGQPIYRATDDEYGDDYVPLSKDACLHYDCVHGWAKKMKREAP